MATRSAVDDGAWDNPVVWDTGVPEAGDEVIITDHEIDINGPAACATLVVQGVSVNTVLVVNDGSTLTVSTSITVVGASAGTPGIITTAGTNSSIVCPLISCIENGFLTGGNGASLNVSLVVPSNTNFIVTTDHWPAGLVGTIDFALYDANGGEYLAPTTDGITETEDGTYAKSITIPNADLPLRAEWTTNAGTATESLRATRNIIGGGISTSAFGF
jgi:hypothetical protein